MSTYKVGIELLIFMIATKLYIYLSGSCSSAMFWPLSSRSSLVPQRINVNYIPCRWIYFIQMYPNYSVKIGAEQKDTTRGKWMDLTNWKPNKTYFSDLSCIARAPISIQLASCCKASKPNLVKPWYLGHLVWRTSSVVHTALCTILVPMCTPYYCTLYIVHCIFYTV